MPRCASTISITISASSAPAQAAETMARSSRRLGRKRPGVSTKMIWDEPSIAMPRMRLRVVCTLCVTIEIFAPTMAFISVDLPAFGSPISATKPQRVASSAMSLSRTGQFLQKGGSCLLFGQFFRARLAARTFSGLERSLDSEERRVIGAGLREQAVGGRCKPPRLRPFLRARLGIGGRRPQPPHALPPVAGDETLRGLHAAIEIKRGDHRLGRIRQDRGFAPPARNGLGAPEPDMLSKPDLARNLGQHLAPDKRVEAGGKLALRRIGEFFQQRFRDAEAEHPVAQEFQPLIVGPRRVRRGWMRQRLLQQLGIAEFMAKEPAKRFPVLTTHGRDQSSIHSPARHRMISKKRSKRHFQICQKAPSEESAISSARPIRFSTGTWPTWEKRLSTELSRLSPMKKM